MLRVHPRRARQLAGSRRRLAWLVRRHLLHVAVAGPGLALGHASGFGQSVDRFPELCLQQVQESTLRGFEPIGLSTFDGPDANPAITMWSRVSLRVLGLSPVEPAVASTFRAALPEAVPLAAAITDWNADTAVVELFDAAGESIWTIRLPSGATAKTPAPAAALRASGALRTREGWVRAHRATAARADTAAIVLAGSGRPDPSGEFALLRAAAPGTEETGRRRIDRVLHMRPDAGGGVLVTEAAFPFTTIAYTRRGIETWRASPAPDELRDLLGETDLRYVIATPAIAVDNATLNTFVALRSGRRISALRFPGDVSARYRDLPSGLAFLGALPAHRLLVATRSGEPYTLVLFRWRWTDQRHSCTQPPT